jgi:hypothetical protein
VTTFLTIPAKRWHCGQMVRLLRHEHQRVMYGIGLDAHAELAGMFEISAFRKAWLIDGRLAGLGGVTGTLLSPHGFVWLALSEQAMRYPVALVKEARRQIAEMMVVKRELTTTLIGGDEAAQRLAVFLGFHVQSQGPGQMAATRYGRRMLARYIAHEPGLRLPIGSGYAIAMGYSGEQL